MNNTELKRCLKIAIEIGENIAGTKKWNTWKLVGFVLGNGGNILYLINNVKFAIDQYQHLTTLERDELSIYFADQFDIPNNKVEAKIEAAFDQLIKLNNLWD